MTSEVTIWRATLSDRQGVLDIDPLMLNGRDHMPSMYKQILQNPKYRSYVAETTGGQIVSFMTLTVDPEERFCGILSARTMKEYQSNGIIQAVVKESFKDMYADFEQIFKRLHVAADKPVYTQTFWSDLNRNLIHRHALLVYLIPHGKIAAAAAACRNSPRVSEDDIQELPPDRAYQVLSDTYTLQHVLRKSHLTAFCNVLPVPKTQKYLRQIASESKVFASFKNGSITKANGISYSSILKGPAYVNVNIYLSMYEHVDLLLSHLSMHLAHAACNVPSDSTVILRLEFPAEIDKEVVKEFLLPTLGVNFLGKSNPKEYVLLWSEAAVPIKGKL